MLFGQTKAVAFQTCFWGRYNIGFQKGSSRDLYYKDYYVGFVKRRLGRVFVLKPFNYDWSS